MKGVRVGEAPPMEALILVASRMCGQPVAALERLDQDDAGEVMEIVLSFFARSLTTGKKASQS